MTGKRIHKRVDMIHLTLKEEIKELDDETERKKEDQEGIREIPELRSY